MMALPVLRFECTAISHGNRFNRCAAAATSLAGSLAMVLAVVLAVVLALGGSPVLAAQPGGDAITPVARVQRLIVNAGSQTVIAITINAKPGFHVWPNQPKLPDELKELDPIATTLKLVTASPGVQAFAASAQWPAGKAVAVKYTESEIQLESLSDGATLFVPVTIAVDAPLGKATVSLALSYQACNERMCFAPREDTVTAEFEIVAATVPAGPVTDATLFGAFDPSVFGRLAASPGQGTAAESGSSKPESAKAEEENSAKGANFDFFGYQFTLRSSLVILLVSFVAGILMNFTPCVLPVIPLKLNSLQKQAAGADGSSAKVVFFGLMFCAGILAVFGVIAILALTLKLAFGQWFSYWYVTVPLALIVALLGLGMMGLFDIALPDSVYNITPKGETGTGNFLMGVLTAVLSTPCTGPMFGAAFAYAVKQDQATAGLFVLTMGAGMAFPYAILIAFPSLVKKLPKGGPGGELLKQVLGLFMLAVAAYIGSNVIEGKWPFYVVGGVAGLAALYWAIGAVRVLRSTTAKVINVVAAVLVLAACVPATISLTSDGPFAWKVVVSPADDALRGMIKDAVAQGRPVVVDFTAKWCTNCLVIEKTILNSAAGVRVLTERRPLAIKVDLTNARANEGWGLVQEISGGGGIPLIAVFGPKQAEPVYFQSFFGTGDLDAAIAKVTGTK